MIYLIGGGARCGKSTLAKSFIQEKPGTMYLSGDSLRQSVRPVLPDFHTSGVDTDNPAKYIDYYKEHTDEAIDETIRRAELVWPFIERYIVAHSFESDSDLIVESVDIWPHLVSKLDMPHKAIFMVDSDSKQWRRVTKYLGQNDWITNKKLTGEQIEAWAMYNAPRGERIIKESAKFGYQYKDIAEIGFESAQSSALEWLLNTETMVKQQD